MFNAIFNKMLIKHLKNSGVTISSKKKYKYTTVQSWVQALAFSLTVCSNAGCCVKCGTNFKEPV